MLHNLSCCAQLNYRPSLTSYEQYAWGKDMKESHTRFAVAYVSLPLSDQTAKINLQILHDLCDTSCHATKLPAQLWCKYWEAANTLSWHLSQYFHKQLLQNTPKAWRPSSKGSVRCWACNAPMKLTKRGWFRPSQCFSMAKCCKGGADQSAWKYFYCTNNLSNKLIFK